MFHCFRNYPEVKDVNSNRLKLMLNYENCLQIIPNFYPLLMDKVRQGIFSSLRQILEKRVLPSLFPLFDSNRLDRELRGMVRETFTEFCYPPPIEGKRNKYYYKFIKKLF